MRNTLLGIWPSTPVEPPVEPTFTTYAMIHDPLVSSFFDWTFIGTIAFDLFCDMQLEFTQWFGLNSEGCFDGYSVQSQYFCEWSNSNGTPCPDQSTANREQVPDISTYFYAFNGNNTPPNLEIHDTGGNPVTLIWEVIQPRNGSVSFTVDDPGACYIDAFMYGYDNAITFPFGIFNPTVINDPGWEMYLHFLIPKATPSTIITSVVGNDVTITVTNMWEFCRSIRWVNPGTAATGTANFIFS